MIQKRKNGYKFYLLKNRILASISIFVTAFIFLPISPVFAAVQCNSNGLCHGAPTPSTSHTGSSTPSGSSSSSSGPSASPSTTSTPAPSYSDPAISCSSNNCDLIAKYVNPAINLFSVLFGLIAVISIILGGISYTTSEGDPQKASKAKSRIMNTIIAVVAYIFLFAFLQFLVPGGAFNR